MKRLFEVVEKSGKPLHPRVFAEHKKDAKAVRDASIGLMIIRGPDHQRFRGATFNQGKDNANR